MDFFNIFHDKKHFRIYAPKVEKKDKLEDSWCALGDVAAFKDPIQNEGKFQVPESILVKSKIPEVLERPSNFKLIWETNSVSIYQMEAPVGYTCLGGIARSRGGIERLIIYILHYVPIFCLIPLTVCLTLVQLISPSQHMIWLLEMT